MENIPFSWLDSEGPFSKYVPPNSIENNTCNDSKYISHNQVINDERNLAQPVEYNEDEHKILSDVSSYHDLSTSVVKLEKEQGCESSAFELVYIKTEYNYDYDEFTLFNTCNIQKGECTYDTQDSSIYSDFNNIATDSSSSFNNSVDETISHVIKKNYDYDSGSRTPEEVSSDDEINTLRRFTCNVCAQDFTSLVALWRHISGTHDNIRNNKCHLCNKTFSRVDYLTLHMRHHTGERPHVCGVCHRGFTQSGSLNKHMQLHSGQRPFECSVCGHRFTESVKLSNHMRRHSVDRPFKCSVCDKTFAERTNLRRHFKTHTGEKPYKCNVCEKAFTESSTLVRHSRIHSEFKPFTCTICSRGFTVASMLNKHMKKHHNEKTGL